MTRFLALIFVAFSAWTAIASPVSAFAADTKADLKARFEARDGDLRKYKRDGRVGETIEGYVEAVNAAAAADEKVATLVRTENADRHSLYQLLADELNAEAGAAKANATRETVATTNAKRNFERAEPGEYLRVARDHWIQKKDEPRYQKIRQAKSLGKVGETSAGLIEAVKPEYAADTELARLVQQENEARTAQYQALAKQERATEQQVARRYAERNFSNARVGDMLKDANGSWRKK